MKKLPAGFASPLILVVVGLIVGIGITFAYFHLKSEPSPQPRQTTTSQTTPTSAPTAKSTPTTDETASWKTYTNPQHNFSIKYPTDYTTEESQEPFGVNFSSPDKKEGNMGVLESGGFINVAVKAAKSTVLEIEFNNFLGGNSPTIDKKATIGLSGIPAIRATYSAGEGSDHTELILIINNGQTYTLTAWSTQKDREKINDVFDQIVSTLKFL